MHLFMNAWPRLAEMPTPTLKTGLPLSRAEGAEMRQPLGLTIIGGLIFSQVLTLYTTPVVYLYLDKLRHRFNKWRGVRTDAALETPL